MRNKTETIWALSLFITGVCSLIICLSAVCGWHLPVLMIRILGVLLLIAIPFVVWSTVMFLKLHSKKDAVDDESEDDKGDNN